MWSVYATGPMNMNLNWYFTIFLSVLALNLNVWQPTKKRIDLIFRLSEIFCLFNWIMIHCELSYMQSENHIKADQGLWRYRLFRLKLEVSTLGSNLLYSNYMNWNGTQKFNLIASYISIITGPIETYLAGLRNKTKPKN